MIEITKGKMMRKGVLGSRIATDASLMDEVEICKLSGDHQSAQVSANADLIVDAFNTYQKCGKLPSQLLSENEEIISSLETFVNAADNEFKLGNKTVQAALDLLTKLKA